MSTMILHTIALDEQRLQADLDQIGTFPLMQPYAEFSAGRPWSGIMLWTPGGSADSGVLSEYDFDPAAEPTVYGRRLPYLYEMIEAEFDLDHLLFVRFAVMQNNVLLPHRDHLELEGRAGRSPGHRLHVPLVTHEEALFLEEDVVFHMRTGEVWCLDVRRFHSAGVFGSRERLHLVLDFSVAGASESLVRGGTEAQVGIPVTHRSPRAPLPADQRAALMSMASLIDVDSFKEVVGLVVKKAYRWDLPAREVWDILRAIVETAEDPDLARSLDSLADSCAVDAA